MPTNPPSFPLPQRLAALAARVSLQQIFESHRRVAERDLASRDY